MTRLSVLLLAFLSACASPLPHAEADSQGQSQSITSLVRQAEGHNPLIAAFAERAAAGDVNGLIALFSETPVRATGEDQLRAVLKEDTIPFFSRMERVDSYSHANGASFDDGTTGTLHFMYIKTKAGTYEPFSIAIREEGGSAKVMNIGVGGCVRSRHPVSEGRCDK